jgi:hypothetical protein
VTVTEQLAVLLFAVFAVIVAVPIFTPVTTPALDTVATLVLDELHVTVLLSASAGETVAVSAVVLPISTTAVVALSVSPVAGMVFVVSPTLFTASAVIALLLSNTMYSAFPVFVSV